MLAAIAFHFAGTGIDDVEELATHWHYPVARGVLRWGGAVKPRRSATNILRRWFIASATSQ